MIQAPITRLNYGWWMMYRCSLLLSPYEKVQMVCTGDGGGGGGGTPYNGLYGEAPPKKEYLF